MKNYLDFKRQLEEKHLTAAEKKKREEIAKAIDKKNPDMPMDKKMAIATAQAKKVAEEYEKLVAEMNELGISEEMIHEASMKDDIFGGIYRFGRKLFGKGKPAETGAKSAEDAITGAPKPRAPDDPMGVQGPVVTQPFKNTDDAAAFTKSELDRITKKAADDAKASRAGAQTGASAADDITSPAPAPKVTQPRDAGGRFTAKTAASAADDIKPPPGAGRSGVKTGASVADDIKPPPAPKGISTTNKVIGGGLALGAAALTADQLLGTDKASSKTPTIPTDDRASKEPAEPPKAADSSSNDSMTFGQAFNAARKAAAEKGAESTGRFTWKGKEYQTNVKGEKYVSRSKQTAVGESFDALPAGSIDEAILMSLSQVKK